jgi:iron complex transport system ATP-binding protein
VIRTRALRASYNGHEVLKGVDLDISEGEFTGLLGPNGCGKTTLLRCLTGSLDPVSGSIEILGKSRSRWRPRELARRMALLPQENNPGFDFRVSEIVSMGRYPHMGRFSFSDRDGTEAVKDAMERCGLGGMEEKSINELSGGERQRVFIARSLAQEPDLLLLDEPTKNLDIRHSLDIMSLVRKLNRERRTTVLAVLHDIDLAARFCDEVALMKDGKLAVKGPRDWVLDERWMREVFDINCRIHAGKRIHVEILD